MSEQRRARVLSGMRPTGMLHLGHYFLLRKWVEMQDECDCYYFVADYHALTTAANRSQDSQSHTHEMIICWLAAGIDPDKAVIFLQSHLREHAELHVLLSMVTPLPWLERVPHYKDMVTKRKPEEINYGFLGYPVLQAADIIVHGADFVPVGEDQEAHVEMTARVARAFNEQYGKNTGWEKQAQELLRSLPQADVFVQLCQRASSAGDADARMTAIEMVHASQLGREATQRLLGWIEGGGRQILKPPSVRRSEVARLPGLDGQQKMSKSEDNDIGMLEAKDSFAKKIKSMPTDPARVRRDDLGNPEKCPVWSYHKLFSNSKDCKYVEHGCTSASIGCIECKGILTDHIDKVINPLREAARPWQENPTSVDKILQQGNERAKQSAAQTMKEVRATVGLPQV